MPKQIGCLDYPVELICFNVMSFCVQYMLLSIWWLGSAVVRALDSHSVGDCPLWVQFPAAALSSNNLGQVVHTNVPLFTKQYNLVRCEGFHANAPVMWQRHGVQ